MGIPFVFQTAFCFIDSIGINEECFTGSIWCGSSVGNAAA